MLIKNIIYGTSYPNVWARMLLDNIDLFDDKGKFYVKKFENIQNVLQIRDYHNVFCLDAYSMECIGLLANQIKSIIESGKTFKLPAVLDVNKPTVFYNKAEGWAAPEFFDALHTIIDTLKLKSNISYCNAAYNINDVYHTYCQQRGIETKLTCYYNGGVSFHNLENSHYLLPKDGILQVRLEDRKLYCSFNWNAWDHRLAMIAMLNYQDLIHDGYVTSPTYNKFDPQKDKDFILLRNRANDYLKDLPEKNQIIEKLQKIYFYYPLNIDDRSQYKSTDQPLTTPELKHPILSARVNSIFELISETRFYGEHFFSEKTYNPIIIGKPFLYWTSAHAFKSLRKIGYKSFSPFIDESYDNIENNAERLKAVCIELNRLKSMREKNPKDFYELVENCYNIAQYNLEMFTLLAHQPNRHNNFSQHLRYMKVC